MKSVPKKKKTPNIKQTKRNENKKTTQKFLKNKNHSKPRRKRSEYYQIRTNRHQDSTKVDICLFQVGLENKEFLKDDVVMQINLRNIHEIFCTRTVSDTCNNQHILFK